MLCAVKSKRARKHRPTAKPASEEVQTLPAWKAFVVQFSRETSLQSSTFSGRVEHISSGRRGRFTSARELLAVLETLLGELGEQ